MDTLPLRWTFAQADSYPPDWLTAVQQSLPPSVEPISPQLGQLLWQRQLGQPDQISGLLDPSLYQPTPASAFGAAMERAIDRLQQALAQSETVTIWGDFDADGVTATAVLWDGLGQLFPKQERLHYYIPNRLYESHGLSRQGLEQVKSWGTNLIIT